MNKDIFYCKKCKKFNLIKKEDYHLKEGECQRCFEKFHFINLVNQDEGFYISTGNDELIYFKNSSDFEGFVNIVRGLIIKSGRKNKNYLKSKELKRRYKNGYNNKTRWN